MSDNQSIVYIGVRYKFKIIFKSLKRKTFIINYKSINYSDFWKINAPAVKLQDELRKHIDDALNSDMNLNDYFKEGKHQKKNKNKH